MLQSSQAVILKENKGYYAEFIKYQFDKMFGMPYNNPVRLYSQVFILIVFIIWTQDITRRKDVFNRER